MTPKQKKGIIAKVWITKYALTTGVFEITAEITKDGSAYDMHTSLPTFFTEREKNGTEQRKLPSLKLKKCARRKLLA